MEAALTGITVNFSSGDSGDHTAGGTNLAAKTVEFPADLPYVTGVGGTSVLIGLHRRCPTSRTPTRCRCQTWPARWASSPRRRGPGKTSPADLAHDTITITNVGVFGVDTGTPILTPGEAAILALDDNRLCTSVVSSVRAKNGDIIGYIGANILVDRRVATPRGPQLRRTGAGPGDRPDRQPLFDENMMPNLTARTEDPALLQRSESNETGALPLARRPGDIPENQGAKWTALLRQPIDVAYKPVRNLVEKEAVIAAWLVVLYAVGSWLVSWLYRNHLTATERIARETSFTETILAHMPIGIALLDSATGRVLEMDGKFLEMAREFGGATGNLEIDDLHLRDLPNLGINEAVERVTGSGRPFQTREQAVEDAASRMHFLSVNLLRLQDTQQRTHGVLLLMEDATHDVETRRDLIAANTAKDQFLALLSHELRNPLSPVITMVSELDKMTDSPGARNALEMIRRNVELEARLIDDLLGITQSPTGSSSSRRNRSTHTGRSTAPWKSAAGYRCETP